ncbi:MAG: hypothetical protein AAGM45_05090 [Cyanobacteria bacterium J06588_5]
MTNPYRGHRFPAEIISDCVWLYHTCPLSFRDIEKMMLYRGITVTDEAIRGWCLKFAQGYANQLRKQRPKPGNKWHLDEVAISIPINTNRLLQHTEKRCNDGAKVGDH